MDLQSGSMGQAGGILGSNTILDKYEKGSLLGKGNFAEVYLAHSLETNTAVAIKVIDSTNTNFAMCPLIVREVAIMHRLHHPNILRIHELLATTTKVYLVMDLARGGDLHDNLAMHQGHRFRLPTALHVFHQLVSAVHFCHRHAVFHRDLKPQNILLDEQGNIKLCDFGLSSIAGEGPPVAGALLKTACGTPAFMAPEVISRFLYDGRKADAWSCGVILYLMLTGAPPFDHKVPLNVMRDNMNARRFTFPTNFNQIMMGLIYRLLDPNPDTRLTINEIVTEEWFKTSQYGRMTSLSLDKSIAKYVGFEMGLSGTAFDIISSSQGLDLWGLVEDEVWRKARRFVVEEAVGTVTEKVVEEGLRLGYEVNAKNGGKIWLKKENLLVVAVAAEVVENLSMVELELLEGCACAYCGFGDDCEKIASGAGVIQRLA